MTREDVLKDYRNAQTAWQELSAIYRMADEILRLRTELAEARKAFDTVARIHAPTFDGQHCTTCSTDAPPDDWVLWPCDTIRAIVAARGEG